MRRRTLLGLAVLALAAGVASPADWKRGKLVDLAVNIPTLPNGKPAPRKVYIYSVDGGEKVYQGSEEGRKAPRVEVNSPIAYSVSKDYLLIRDSDGKTHKLALMKTTRK
jgi:hypothetical protein